MSPDPENTVVQLCAQGMRAEGEGRDAEARSLFTRAWESAGDDYEACVAAHYLARCQSTPEDALHWNLECLARADRVGDERVRPFYASLHGSIGGALLELGEPGRARGHFEAAAGRLADLPPGQYAQWLRLCVARGLRATGTADPGAAAGDPLPALMERLCARVDLDSLGLLLPAYLGDLGGPEDAERLTTALRMLHAERRLPGPEQTALGRAIAARTAAAG
ncbi:hypothetical protein [Streptomyces jumonjinensis]|uniref:Tetratricopeptide repeat protein n=1 Tax=Streptomyces jumonjinensis TaxID=1945 RepID=A0A646KN73_STRJU|nr:hypothetical protein [Streptomyces jumonjinensis]MQT03774.1 hypothetical protein [Streptomyces jumonjinensis]